MILAELRLFSLSWRKKSRATVLIAWVPPTDRTFSKSYVICVCVDTGARNKMGFPVHPAASTHQ